MKTHALIALLLFGRLASFAGTFDTDTIDNWQIYNGDKLILAGNRSIGSSSTDLRWEDLQELRIHFNHCSPVKSGTITITVVHSDKASLNWSKKFSANPSGNYVIPVKEVKTLLNKHTFSIWYSETTEDPGRNLGSIRITDTTGQ